MIRSARLYATLASDPSFTSALHRSPELAAVVAGDAELASGLARSAALRTALASQPGLADVIAKDDAFAAALGIKQVRTGLVVTAPPWWPITCCDPTPELGIKQVGQCGDSWS